MWTRIGPDDSYGLRMRLLFLSLDHLTNLSESPNRRSHNQRVNIEEVIAYREADDDYFDWLESQ